MMDSKPGEVTRQIIRDILAELREVRTRQRQITALRKTSPKQWHADEIGCCRMRRADLTSELVSWWPDRNAHQGVGR